MFQLSDEYKAVYDKMLKQVGSNRRILQNPLSLFWPMRGHQYDDDLFVIGRRPNGTDVNPDKQQLLSDKYTQLITKVRGFSEPKAQCPMLWLTDPVRYNANRSAFFKVAKRISLRDVVPNTKRDADWASWICYSNLLKVAPAKPPDKKTPVPSKTLKDTQLPYGTELVRMEIEAFRPRHVLVLTGKDWFSDFADGLGLKVKWRKGYVEGVAEEGHCQWVIAKHPDRKPLDPFIDEVLEALGRRQQ